MKILPKGHVSILSSVFRYTPAVRTDIAKTFERIREQQRRAVRLIPVTATVRILKAGR